MHGPTSRQQAVLRAILESPQNIVIFALDRDYRYLAFNQLHAQTMRQIWGAELAVGDCMLNVLTREDDALKARANFDRALAGESFVLLEEYGDERMHRLTYENVYSPIRDDQGDVLGLAVYLTDITARVRAERELTLYRDRLEELVKRRTEELEAAHAQLLHVQKLEGLGVLAGGIAHDFNNLLAVVLGRVELASGELERGHGATQHLDVVRETALEARMLTKQLLGYAGKGKFLVHNASLNELVDSAMQLLRASVSKQISFVTELQQPAPSAELDSTQFRQVLLNLVVNAAEAIGERSGQISLRTSTLYVDESMLRRSGAITMVADGRYSCIEVSDTGAGIEASVRNKLFDPFFTTKFAGRGLGLAAVLGIVRSHRGTILLTSEPGKGTCFRVLFPATNDDSWQPPVRPTALAEPLRGEQGYVLVVDDEHAVRDVTCALLRALGYPVMSARDGKQAIEFVKRRAEAIRTVLLDLTMPEMNGKETLQAIRAIKPGIEIILMTGYSADEINETFAPGELQGCLSKPFSRAELLAALAQKSSR